jgi:hypothetical protein
MNLQGIVAVSGKPGLWRALAQNKTGYVLESLDAQKTKLIANLSTAKLAALNEITIFGLEDDIKLVDVLERMKAAASIPATKDDGKKLREFFFEVAPDHDEEKVYSSDIKKIISWYTILKDLPLFNETPAEVPVAEEAVVADAAVAEPVLEEAPVAEAPKAKKAPAKKA